jgi:decaprenylphospho-beta-D-ribofuranose 2-oxidase
VATLEEAHAELRVRESEGTFSYSWHDPVPRSRGFGRGILYQCRIVSSTRPTQTALQGLARLGRRSARLPFPVFGWGTRLATGVHWAREHLRGRDDRRSLSEGLFPLAHSPEYFQLYGRRGLAEYQVLVPPERTGEFLARLRELVLRHSPPAVMLALRSFRGEQRLLRFEGDGLCVTLDLARSARGIAFLERLDELTAAVEALPNLIKDSRLPAAVVRRCYREYERFGEELRRFDPARLFRSELSTRLGL